MHGVLRCNIFSAWLLDIRTYQLVFLLFTIISFLYLLHTMNSRSIENTYCTVISRLQWHVMIDQCNLYKSRQDRPS